MVVHPQVVVEPWRRARHQKRGRLFAALVSTRGLAGLERSQEALAQLQLNAPFEGFGHGGDHLGPGEHVARDAAI